MRISDRMIQTNTMAGLRGNMLRLAEAQRHATSGRRIERISDDPVDAAQAMHMQGQIANLEQFKRNAISATTRMSTEATVLESARELLARARKLAIGVNADDPADPTRTAAFQELRYIKDQLVSLANTRIGGERIFGGGLSSPPFQANGQYVGGQVVHDVQIDESMRITTSHPGTIFAAAFSGLDQLIVTMQSGTPAQISAGIAPLATAEEELLAGQAETGSRQRQIDDTVAQLGSRQRLLLDRASKLTDADPAEALLKVQAATQALERAYVVAQRTLSLNIVDYMR